MLSCRFCSFVLDPDKSLDKEYLYVDDEGKKHTVRILEESLVCDSCKEKFGEIPRKE